jgi:DNA-binding MarR family transcriptional regulator
METGTVSTPEQPFARNASLGYLVNQLAKQMRLRLEARLAGYGVPPGQFALLLVLWEEAGLTQSEIARRLDFEQPTVANTLKRMIRDGLVQSSPDPASRKQVLVFLTEKARQLCVPLIAEAKAVNAEAVAALTAEEAAGLQKSIAKVIDALR